jgi:S1-C subfamily serine protease
MPVAKSIWFIVFCISAKMIYSQCIYDLPHLIETVKPATVTINVINYNSLSIINQGSGFFVSPDVIVSSRHLFWNPQTIQERNSSFGLIITNKKNDKVEYYAAAVLGDYADYDKILIQVTPKDSFPDQSFLKIADSVTEGESVFVVSTQHGFPGVTTTGIISAVHNKIDIQFTAPISEGSSGAPILNTYGDVIGMVSGYLPSGQLLNFGISLVNSHEELASKLDGIVAVEAGLIERFPSLEEWVINQNMLHLSESKRPSSGIVGAITGVVGAIKDCIVHGIVGIVAPKNRTTTNLTHPIRIEEDSNRAITDA